MKPQELAQQIMEELAVALTDLEPPQHLQVVDIIPPDLLDAETFLSVVIADSRGKTAELTLPSSLALGYLADEEAAVDEWRIWVQEIAARLSV
jgi:hypothetical protein